MSEAINYPPESPQQEREGLRQGYLELSVLYEISNEFNTLFNYEEILTLSFDAISKVLEFDYCSILVTNFGAVPSCHESIGCAIDEQTLISIQKNTLRSFSPFSKKPLDWEEIDYKTAYKTQQANDTFTPANLLYVPLYCKNEIFGMLHICNNYLKKLSQQQITFIYTLANEIAGHLFRIQLIKDTEKTKINSLIKSMEDGIVMLDEQHQVEIINPAAKLYLDPFKDARSFMGTLQNAKLTEFYKTSLTSHNTISKDIVLNDKSISMRITPVLDRLSQRIGTVFILRDFTEIEKINRIKSQRLEIISKVNLILNTITNLDNLLSVLMNFILNVAGAEMGAIQLEKNHSFKTIVHANFPDKIRSQYTFKGGLSISDYTIENKNILLVDDYCQKEQMNQKVKILIDTYICIPIIVKQNLIGVINIARKMGKDKTPISSDDIETLNTITKVSGTAIHNAMLYQASVKKEQLDHELKVAYTIQKDLLPSEIPKFGRFDIHAVSIPARFIGGDYFDFFSIDENHMGIVIADIIGKGIPAGLFMAMLKSLLHTHLNTFTSPKEALTVINEVFNRDKIINKFIPMFYAVINKKTKTLTYTNAGHEPALALNGERFKELDTTGYPVGAFPQGKYEEKSLTLKPDSLCVFYTDGVIEARNKSGKQFGASNIKKLAKDLRYQSSKQITKGILKKIQSFSEPLIQEDDITLLTLKLNPYGTKVSKLLFKEQVKVSSEKKHIKVIRKRIEKFSEKMGFPGTEIFNIKLAVNEAHANVIEHAYNGKSNGEILFRFFAYTDKLIVKIRDYSKSPKQRSTKGEHELEELEGSGLGTFLIKSIVDDAVFSKTSRYGSELTLTKFLNKEGG